MNPKMTFKLTWLLKRFATLWAVISEGRSIDVALVYFMRQRRPAMTAMAMFIKKKAHSYTVTKLITSLNYQIKGKQKNKIDMRQNRAIKAQKWYSPSSIIIVIINKHPEASIWPPFPSNLNTNYKKNWTERVFCYFLQWFSTVPNRNQ